MVVGAEECGASAGKDLEEEKGDNTRTNNNDNLEYPAVRYVGVGAVTSTTGGLHVNQSVPALGTES